MQANILPDESVEAGISGSWTITIKLEKGKEK